MALVIHCVLYIYWRLSDVWMCFLHSPFLLTMRTGRWRGIACFTNDPIPPGHGRRNVSPREPWTPDWPGCYHGDTTKWPSLRITTLDEAWKVIQSQHALLLKVCISIYGCECSLFVKYIVLDLALYHVPGILFSLMIGYKYYYHHWYYYQALSCRKTLYLH